jgi:hypothetical protein
VRAAVLVSEPQPGLVRRRVMTVIMARIVQRLLAMAAAIRHN